MQGSGEQNKAAVCGLCGSQSVREAWQQQTFPYGDDPVVELHAHIPLMTCQACGFEFTDERAAAIRHDEACRHQGLVTSHEIKRVREKIYFMTRKEFERAFGVSEASLERWENRKLFPSKQATTLFRVLADKSIGERLIAEANAFSVRASNMRTPNDITVRFRSLVDSPALRQNASTFRLRAVQAVI